MKLPPKHVLASKGEHAFHSSYLAVESVVGHGLLQWLALAMLICIVAHVLFALLESM